jgi:hypothetical protein
MNRIAMSTAAAGLLRALIARAGAPKDRILLTDVRSTDWQSLTLIGERHRFELRVVGPDADAAVSRICCGIEDAEFHIPRQIVADINIAGEPARADDGSICVIIEALTVEE